MCNEQPLCATITSEFECFKLNLKRVLDKWSTLSYFKIPKKVSNILINSNSNEQNTNENNLTNDKFDRYYF